MDNEDYLKIFKEMKDILDESHKTCYDDYSETVHELELLVAKALTLDTTQIIPDSAITEMNQELYKKDEEIRMRGRDRG